MACKNCHLNEAEPCEKCNVVKVCQDCGPEGVCPSCAPSLGPQGGRAAPAPERKRPRPKVLGFGMHADEPLSKVPITYLYEEMNNYNRTKEQQAMCWLEIKRRNSK